LAKILKSRWTFVRTATRYFWVERRSPLMVLMACVEQVLKATLDILATGTNLNYRLLSQRAQQSCSDVEIKKWQHVWSSVSEVTHER
jgi:NAD-dependent oxidoreductase involved in siderophore biosynthesis